MRSKGLVIAVVIGIALILAGIVLAALPLVSHTGKTISPGTPFTYHVSETIPILPSVLVAVSWTSTGSVEVVMWTCSSFNGDASTVATQCARSHPLYQNGTSGSTTISVPLGDTLIVTAQAPGGIGTPPNVTITPKSTSSTIGFGLIALGVIGMIAGILLSRGPTAPESEPASKTHEPPMSETAPASGASESDDEEPLDAIG